MGFLLFIVYLIINAILFLIIYKNISLYKENQLKYDYIDIETDKSNKDWFYYLMEKYQIKGHAYQVIGKDFEHYYKEDLKIVYFGKEFFRTQNIYSVFAIFFNISLISLLNNEQNKYFNMYLKYHNYYVWIFILSLFGSFLIFTKPLFLSGIVFMIIYIICIVFEFILAKKIRTTTMNLIKSEITLTKEQESAMNIFAKSESFYFFSVFLNKRNKKKGFD